jgi:hypothetical protein
MEYPAGSLKHDPATGSVAIRTEFPEVGALVNHAWLVATVGAGAVNKTSADVEAWTDIDGYPVQAAEPEPAPTA